MQFSLADLLRQEVTASGAGRLCDEESWFLSRMYARFGWWRGMPWEGLRLWPSSCRGPGAQSRWIDRRLRGPRFWAGGLLGGSRSNLQSAQAKPVTGLDKSRGLSHGGLTVSHGLPQCQDPWLKPR